MTDPVKHLTQNDLAARWNKSVHTIERYRHEGTGPVYLKIGGKVIYRLVDIESFESERLYQRTTALAPHAQLNDSGLTLHQALKQFQEQKLV